MKVAVAGIIAIEALVLAILWPPIAGHNDYVQLRSGGQALLAGLDLYDAASWAMRPLVVEQQPPSPIFTYPPWVAVAFVPFALLPLELGSLIWSVGGLAAAIVMTGRVARRWSWPPVPGIALAVASWPATLVFLQGQWGFALYALAALCLLALASRRDGVAGVAWGIAILTKPQLFLLGSLVLAFWSLVMRRPRIVLAALATVAFGVAVGTIAQPRWLEPYVAHLRGPVTARATQQPTLAGLAGDVAGDRWPVAWATLLVALAVVVIIAIRRAPAAQRLSLGFAAVLALSVSSALYSWSYDQYLVVLLGTATIGVLPAGAPWRLPVVGAIALLFGPIAFGLFESAYVRWHDTLAGLVPVLALLLASAAVLRPART